MRTWVANSVTVVRLFFFVGCVWELAHSSPVPAIFLFGIAWGLDAIDGAIARYFGAETVLGSHLDKTIDRIIMIGSVVFLLRYEYVPHMAVFLLVKDVALSMALTVKPSGKPFPSAGQLGKLTSTVQGIGILWLFFAFPGQLAVVIVVGLLGGYVAVDYLRKI